MVFTPTVSGSVTINLTCAGSYTGLMLYDDCPISTACVAATGNCIAYAQSSIGNKTLTVCVTAGVTYYLVLDSWPSPTYNDYSNLTISAPTGASAVNDLPCNAIPLPLGVNLNGDNGCTNATNEPAAPGCWIAPNVRNTVWYAVVPTGTTLKIRTTPGTLRNTQIAVYTGACGPGMTLVNCNDDAAPCGSTVATISELSLTGLTPGATYFVVVDGYGDQYGTFSIMAIDGAQVFPPIFGQECQVPNPVCNQTISVGDPGYQLFGTTCDFPGGGTNCLLSGERGSAWYEIQINGNGILTFNIVPNDWPGAPSTVGTDYDFAIWKKTGSGAVTCADIASGAAPLRCNYSALGVTGLYSATANVAPPAYPNFDGAYEAQINVVNGEVYWLVLSNYSNSTSGFAMTFGGASPINYTPNPGYVVWSGGVNTDWFNTGNWGGCAIPSCTIDAIIPPSSANQPIISAPGAACKNITINAGSSLGINGGFQLQVCGNYINTGTLNAAATSTVLLNNGSVNQTMDGNMVGTSSFGNVTVTKTGGLVTTLDNITMKGNFTVSNASSTFDANAKNHLLAGHFLNTGGTYTSGVNGYLELNGAANQDYQNAGTINHCNVTKTGGNVNQLSNLTLGTNGNLSLNNGVVITNPAYMVIVNNRNIAACTPGHNASFVNGTIRRYLNPTGSYDFPVGNTAKGFQRANVNFAYPGNPTSIDHLTASFNNYATVPGGIGGNECGNTYTSPALNNGYWTINASNNPTSGNYDMCLNNQNYTNATTAWTVMKNSGAGWGLWNGTCMVCPVGSVSRLNMNGFSDFGVAQAGAPLPVQFLSFDAHAKTDFIALDWITAAEKDNHHFDLLRSTDNSNFEKIANILPTLFSSVNHQYFYNDKLVKKGQRYYYQVRQVDLNGESMNSVVRDAILGDNNFGFSAQPNPFEKNTILNFEIENPEFVKLSIYSSSGQLIKVLANEIIEEGKYAYTFSPETPGYYTAQLVVGEDVIFIRLVNFE
ncbi:MAG: T9SS type A sorting domain-containing protein [Bacteroidetes bacterium]|nr:T9SS type A sorting domain-containing protein [Bacteroidota bacterium]